MAASEIDDIFSGKVVKNKGEAAAATTRPTGKERAKSDLGKDIKGKSKAKSKSKDDGTKSVHGAVKAKKAVSAAAKASSSSSARAAVTVVDPSKAIEASAARKGKDKDKGKSKPAEKGSRQGRAALSAEDEDFMDTRGKKRARTDDGYAVYSEAELGIGNKGGDTPLCPFDCDCCF